MILPPFRPSIEPEMRQVIETKLGAVESDFGVRILFAIESGSRAWGFPSPDSDYDVRFVYAHPVEWYLALEPGCDVLELPIAGNLDISGWDDIRKALNLLLKLNPVMLEWLSSPIRYRRDDDINTRLIALSRETAHASACIHHYLHLGKNQWRRHVDDKASVNYKKYFYVLRPALAIRWVRLNPEVAPPMNIQDMSNCLDLDAETVADISRLLDLKGKAREIGRGERIARLDRLIEDELAWADSAPVHAVLRDLTDSATALFRKIVKESGPWAH